MGELALGHDDKPRGLLVQAVDQAGTFRPTAVGQLTSAPDERVHEGPSPVSRGWMDDHSGRFVHNQKVSVLEHDAERNVLAPHLSVIRRCFWHCYVDDIAG